MKINPFRFVELMHETATSPLRELLRPPASKTQIADFFEKSKPQLRIYVSKPSALKMQGLNLINDGINITGHTFASVVSKDKEVFIGLQSRMAEEGINTTPKDIIFPMPLPFSDFLGLNKSVDGIIKKTKEKFDVCAKFIISQKEADSLIQYIDEISKNPMPRYRLITDNCVSLVCNLANKIGINIKPQSGGFNSPAELIMKLREIMPKANILEV
jgi:hypothetical protein